MSNAVESVESVDPRIVKMAANAVEQLEANCVIQLSGVFVSPRKLSPYFQIDMWELLQLAPAGVAKPKLYAMIEPNGEAIASLDWRRLVCTFRGDRRVQCATGLLCIRDKRPITTYSLKYHEDEIKRLFAVAVF
jgi:hypothetical protein